MTDKIVPLPLDMAERLIDIAARAQGVNDSPTLLLFAEVRRLIEQARRAPPRV